MGKKQLSSKTKTTAKRTIESHGLSSHVANTGRMPTGNGNKTSVLDVGGSPVLGLAIGAGLTLTFLMPVDSISGVLGDGLPWVAFWLATSLLIAWLSWRRWLERCVSDLTLPVCTARSQVVLAYAWLLVLVWAVSVTILQWQQGNDRYSVNMLWQYVGTAFCSLALASYCTTPQRRGRLMILLILFGAGLSAHGLYQYFVSMPANRVAFEQDPIGMMRQAGIEATLGSQGYQQFKNRVESTEPFATFALANSLATVLGMTFVLSLAFALRDWLRRRNVISAVVWLITLVLIGSVLVLTKSRAAWIGTALATVGLMLSAAWSQIALRKPLLWIGSIGSVAVLGLGYIGFRQDPEVFLEATKSLQYRFEYWIATTAMIADHLLTGVGLGQFQSHYTWYKLPQASETVADPHNWILDILATTGVGGGVVWLMFAGILWRYRRSILRQNQLTTTMAREIDRDRVLEQGHDGESTGVAPRMTSVKPRDSKSARERSSLGEANWPLFAGAALGIPVTIMLGLPIGNFPDLIPLLITAITMSVLGVAIYRLAGGPMVVADVTPLGSAIPPPSAERPQSTEWITNQAANLGESWCWLWPSVVWSVSLLAAGGWMVAGVTLPMALLLAVWVGEWGNRAEPELEVWRFERNRWLLGQLGKVTIFGLFLWSAWNPVINLRAILDSANFSGRLSVETLQQGTEVDQLDPRPWRLLARHWVEEAISGKLGEPAKANEAIEQWIQRDSADTNTYRNAADLTWLLAFAETQRGNGDSAEKLLSRTLQLYRSAEERYPNNATSVLQLAAIQEAIGSHETAVGLADRAKELDQSHNHRDRKLEIQSIWWPGFHAQDSTIGTRSRNDFYVPASEVLKRISSSSR